MAAMEFLRLALTPFPALAASAPPSRIDRQLREVAAGLAALLSPEEVDAMLPDQQAAQEDAVHLLLDTFCRAHAEDHMSDHTKLGSWRLPYVAMLHSHASLHLPLIRRLEFLLHSSGACLGPTQCSALSTFILFMSPYRILQRDLTVDVDQVDGSLNVADLDMDSTSPRSEGNMDARSAGILDDSSREELRSKTKEKQAGNCHVKVLFQWRWEACFRAQSVALERKDQDENSQVQDQTSEFEKTRVKSTKSQFTGSAEVGIHWMDQFCDAFLLDSEVNILWATRFAASYLRNLAVYWEHILFNKDCREAWLLTDLALQLKNITLVGPIFVAFVPQTMVVFLIWLQQRLDFAFHFESPETTGLKKSLALCETVLASPLGVLLRSTKVPLPLSKIFELELRIGWKEWILSKSRHLFLRYVVWGGAISRARDLFNWGLLWKDYGGDRTRACIELTEVFLTSQFKQNKESPFVERKLSDATSCRFDDDDIPKSSWSGTKKQCVRADTPELQNMPQLRWLKESDANPAEVHILQIIIELSSKLDPQCGPWFLEAAFDCLNNQARLENAILAHCETCAFAHKCKSRQYNSGVCSAYRLKSCIAALSPLHSISQERLYKMEKVFMFCWLGDGPFSIDFAGQLLLNFHNVILKGENRWSSLLLATWVRFFNAIRASILSLPYMVGDIDLRSILANLHTTQHFLTSNSMKVCPDIDGFKEAAMAMPQLAAVTVIEALFTASPRTNLLSREGFLSELATEASQDQHEVSGKVVDILRKITKGLELQGSCIDNDHETAPENEVRLFLKSLLFDLVDLSSMAAISSPDLIIKKWTAYDYKRKWVHEYNSSVMSRELQGNRVSNPGKAHGGGFRDMDASLRSQEIKKATLPSLASLELELDERTGNPQKSVWDLLLDWVVTLISLYPYSVSQLILNTKASDATQSWLLDGEAFVIAAGSIAAGPKALTLSLVVAGLPRNTVLSLLQSVSIKASWTLLLSQMRMGLENGFRQLFLVDERRDTCDFSAMKAEMDSYLLKLQGIV